MICAEASGNMHKHWIRMQCEGECLSIAIEVQCSLTQSLHGSRDSQVSESNCMSVANEVGSVELRKSVKLLGGPKSSVAVLELALTALPNRQTGLVDKKISKLTLPL